MSKPVYTVTISGPDFSSTSSVDVDKKIGENQEDAVAQAIVRSLVMSEIHLCSLTRISAAMVECLMEWVDSGPGKVTIAEEEFCQSATKLLAAWEQFRSKAKSNKTKKG